MLRPLLLSLVMLAVPALALAVEAPAGQARIDSREVLRGHFVEERRMSGLDQPLRTTGHFVVAPAFGLIWGIERPMATATIITPQGMVQDIGGMVVKLPTKNLGHLYDMVGGALEGDWDRLESDFIVKRSGDAPHWQMLLTPRPSATKPLPYTTITVTGSRFVESIVMTKADGTGDAFSFTDAVLSPAPPTAQEVAAFNAGSAQAR